MTKLIVALMACGSIALAAEKIAPPRTGPGLLVTDGSVPIVEASAKGVQIYTCKPLADAPSKFGFDGAHAEPDALLFDKKGAVIIHHYFNSDPAGPAWEATDGSKVIAKKIDPVEPHPGTIPWLRLQATSHEGTGRLSNVTFIQRVDTTGGAAPTGECDPARNPRVRVPYTATYYFYGKP